MLTSIQVHISIAPSPYFHICSTPTPPNMCCNCGVCSAPASLFEGGMKCWRKVKKVVRKAWSIVVFKQHNPRQRKHMNFIAIQEDGNEIKIFFPCSSSDSKKGGLNLRGDLREVCPINKATVANDNSGEGEK